MRPLEGWEGIYFMCQFAVGACEIEEKADGYDSLRSWNSPESTYIGLNINVGMLCCGLVGSEVYRRRNHGGRRCSSRGGSLCLCHFF